MKQISVMLPIYNGEKYLKKCVDSVLAQEYKNLSIILVDNGSEDNSGKMCDAYAAADKRVHVIHYQKNIGVSGARNAAIDLAEVINPDGYIIGIDCDDWYDRSYLMELVAFMEEKQLDCSIGNSKRITVDENDIVTGEENRILFDTDFIIEREEDLFKLQANACAARVNDFEGWKGSYNALRSVATVWDKLYKMSIIKNNHLRFVHGVGSREDIIFSLNYLHYCKKAGYKQSNIGYNYRVLAGSESHRYRETIVAEDDKAIAYMNEYLTKISNHDRHKKMVSQGVYLATIRFFIEECNRYFLLSEKTTEEKIGMIESRAAAENVSRAAANIKQGNLSKMEAAITEYINTKKYDSIYRLLCGAAK